MIGRFRRPFLCRAWVIMAVGGACVCGFAIHAENTARARMSLMTAMLVHRYWNPHSSHPEAVLTDLRAVLHPQRLVLMQWNDAVLNDEERTQMRLGHTVMRNTLFSEALVLLVPGPDGRVLELRSEAPPIRIALVSGCAWLVGLVLVALLWLTTRRTTPLDPKP